MTGKKIEQCGKSVRGARYLHIDAIPYYDDADQSAIADARSLAGETAWRVTNVVKVHGWPPKKVTLLAYERFDTTAFPKLLDSWTVNLDNRDVCPRSFRTSANPPILHRKELLLPPNDPSRARYEHLTKQLEQRGVFATRSQIGFKKQWERALARAGLEVHGHEIIDVASASARGGDSDEC